MNYLILYLTSCVAIDRDSCCNTDLLVDFHETDYAQVQCMTQCILRLGLHSIEENDFILKQTQCTYDCIGKHKGYLTEDGKFLTKRFLNYTTNRLRDMKQQKVINTCFKEHQNNDKPEEYEYNDAELKILYCIYKDIQLKCPIIKQHHPKKCMELQKFLRFDDQPIPRKSCASTANLLSKFSSLFAPEEEEEEEQEGD